MMIGKCISLRKDGRVCGRPAIAIDYKRGGMVCQEHAIELLSSSLANLHEQIWELGKALQNLRIMSGYQDNQADPVNEPICEHSAGL
jgi:hypothetical protein